MREDRSPTPKRKKQIINERVKIIVLYPFKNNLLSTSISLCLFTVLFFISIPSPYYLVIYVIAWWMLYPFFSDFLFYASYYDTRNAVARLLPSSKKEGQRFDLKLERFQINYNRLRKGLKKHIRASRGNLLTYDYEISRIVQDVDTFFDATTKILFRRKVMSIPFSPHDEYDMRLEDIEIQSRLADDRWQNIEPPPSEYEFEAWEIKEIDFRTIAKFLKYFGDIIIRKPRTKAINTVAIGELFRKWNLIVKKVNEPIFEESKKDVEKYYDEKRERRGFLLKMLFELSVLLMVGIISGVLAYYFTI